MRPLKALAIISTGTVIATGDTSTACGGLSTSTIYITMPASPTTETVYVASNGPSMTNVGELSTTNGNSRVSTAITTTVTSYLVSTQIVSVVREFSPNGSKDQGPYSFAVENGTTTWMGGRTPPASLSLSTSVSYVTLQPVPAIPFVSLNGSTPGAAISSIQFVTETLTETATEVVSIVSNAAKSYTGFGLSGWNATHTTLSPVKTSATGYPKPTPSINDKHALYNGTSKDVKTTLDVNDEQALNNETGRAKPFASGSVSRYLHARKAEDLVIVTGVDVSWTNTYDTTSPSTLASDASTTLISSPVLPIYPWDLNPPSYPASSNPSALSTTSTPSYTEAPIYPWNVSHFSSPSGISIARVPAPSMVAISQLPSPALTLSALYSNTSITSTPAATPVSTSCDYSSADFTVTFDDLPHFDVSSDVEDTDIPPIFNPYRKLYWEDHFGYVPPPSDPYAPHSPPQLAVYRAGGVNDVGSRDAGLVMNGEIGAGSRSSDTAYWIDAHSAWLGCSDGGSTDCSITINGFRNESSEAAITQTITQQPCPGLKNCSLTFVEMNGSFLGLSGLQIVAAIAGKPVDYYIDDLKLEWSDNTCTAQQERSSSQ